MIDVVKSAGAVRDAAMSILKSGMIERVFLGVVVLMVATSFVLMGLACWARAMWVVHERPDFIVDDKMGGVAWAIFGWWSFGVCNQAIAILVAVCATKIEKLQNWITGS